jgi:hypothetical protein
MSEVKRYGVRNHYGTPEVIWIENTSNGFWRGIALPDGKPSRGPTATLLGRFHTQEEAERFKQQSCEGQTA